MTSTLETGETFGERVVESDPVTGREVWRLTSRDANAGISFHFRSQFTADSRYLTFRRSAGARVGLMRADMRSGELTVVATAPATALTAFAVVPGTRLLAAVWKGGIRTFDLDTLEERILLERLPEGWDCWAIFGTLDGAGVGFEMFRALPETVPMSHTYDTATWDAYVRHFGGRPGRIDVADLATGSVRTVWEEPLSAGNHVQPSPTDPDLWLVERDRPPLFSWMGDHGRTPRAWLVNWRRSEGRPVPTRNDNHFQMHSAWSHDGRYVYYHGRDRATGAPIGRDGGGHFIGAASTEGVVAWEHVYPHFHYGHVAGHTRRNVILIDSLTTPDLIQEVDFLAAPAPDAEAPLRVLGRHGSQVRYGRQETHPHLQMSPDGQWIAYNRGDGTRADVCALRVESEGT